MKQCPQCGRQVPDDKRFCPGCRAYMPQNPIDGPEPSERAWFRCPRCGATFERVSRNGEPPAFGVCNTCGFCEDVPPAAPPEMPEPAPPKKLPDMPAKGRQTVPTDAPRTPSPAVPLAEAPAAPPVMPPITPSPAPPRKAAPKKERGGLRWWHIAVPALLLALAVVGLFAYRTTQPPVEDAWYDANKAVKSVNYYDKAGHLSGCDGYADGEIAYTKEYRSSDDADRIDASEVEQMEGVVTSECLQVYQRNAGHAGFMPQDTYKVFGYDRRGNLLAEQQYYWPKGSDPILAYTTLYERDVFGRIVSTTITAGNGDAFLHHEYDPKSVFGLCTQADVTETQYGTLEYADGAFYVDPYSPTREVRYVVKYRH